MTTPNRNSIFICAAKRKGQAMVTAWPYNAFLGVFGGRGLDVVWPGFSVAALKDIRL
jgi:hypothetical protein